ncbi:hypothetical protein BC827DRAFT_1158852 [Russula dissimulans]|nr:hypothetical protein BC827DRAFT_1158852 [Russula dissimulans]
MEVAIPEDHAASAANKGPELPHPQGSEFQQLDKKMLKNFKNRTKKADRKLEPRGTDAGEAGDGIAWMRAQEYMVLQHPPRTKSRAHRKSLEPTIPKDMEVGFLVCLQRVSVAEGCRGLSYGFVATAGKEAPNGRRSQEPRVLEEPESSRTGSLKG